MTAITKLSGIHEVDNRTLLTVHTRTSTQARSNRDDSLTIGELRLRVSDHKGCRRGSWADVVEVPGGLGMSKVVLSVRTSLNDEDLELGVSICKPASNQAS